MSPILNQSSEVFPPVSNSLKEPRTPSEFSDDIFINDPVVCELFDKKCPFGPVVACKLVNPDSYTIRGYNIQKLVNKLYWSKILNLDEDLNPCLVCTFYVVIKPNKYDEILFSIVKGVKKSYSRNHLQDY